MFGMHKLPENLQEPSSLRKSVQPVDFGFQVKNRDSIRQNDEFFMMADK